MIEFRPRFVPRREVVADLTALVVRHRLGDPDVVHTNLEASRCSCAVPPGLDGPACSICGGLTMRTGTCATCVDCGASTGCGG